MSNVSSFLLGSGRWSILYVVCYFWYFVFPGLTVTGTVKEYWKIASTGGTSAQGANSLGMIMPFLFVPVVVGPVLLLSSILFIMNQQLLFWQKLAFVLVVSVILPLALGATGSWMPNRIVHVLYFGTYLALFVAHLYMMKNRFTV